MPSIVGRLQLYLILTDDFVCLLACDESEGKSDASFSTCWVRGGSEFELKSGGWSSEMGTSSAPMEISEFGDKFGPCTSTFAWTWCFPRSCNGPIGWADVVCGSSTSNGSFFTNSDDVEQIC